MTDKTNRRLKNMFLSQSYADAWEDYEKSIKKTHFIKWDYIIITASNEQQGNAYRLQLENRLKNKRLSRETVYAVIEDPDGKRVGSGGATLNVLRYLKEELGCRELSGKRILLIHSGGDSKRIPQYSAIGKLFSPFPRLLPDGRPSTLFDEIMIGMSGVPSRLSDGMIVLSGDALLLMNPLQIDAQITGAAALSIKEPVETGKDHGVFLVKDKNPPSAVSAFLHKQSEAVLRSSGAVNERDCVDLDTGAIILGVPLLEALYSLISDNGIFNVDKFYKFVNEKARISFYGDFLYPLAKDSTLEGFYMEAPEGELTEELLECRKEIWRTLEPFSLRLIYLSPAKFIHFGTTIELRSLMAKDVMDYEFLGWSNNVLSNVCENKYGVYNSYISESASIGSGSFIENSYILGNTVVGKGAVISGLMINNKSIPDNVVLHGIPLEGGYICRIYEVEANPKLFISEKDSRVLWDAKLFPLMPTMDEAIDYALELYSADYNIASEINTHECKITMMSLGDSFNKADVTGIIAWQNKLMNRVLSKLFIDRLLEGQYYEDAYMVFPHGIITEEIFFILMEEASKANYTLKIRIYYALSKYMYKYEKEFDGLHYDDVEDFCFGTIKSMIKTGSIQPKICHGLHICEESVDVNLPVRVNLGGGWTDTPPHCNERGGIVLNAAIKLGGINPIQISIRKLQDYYIELESQDIGVHEVFKSIDDIRSCSNPFDPFALHKAALIACGIVPDGSITLEAVLKRLGGGIYLSTQVIGIPKGSGLGTSSILAGACVKGLFEFVGLKKSDNEIFHTVLYMEQIMSTGGGWQDQVGGIVPGIKLITSRPGINQSLEVETLNIQDSVKAELEERFALIYTGQRRLARNILRDVMGGYIGGRPDTLDVLSQMGQLALKMKDTLEKGNIDEFAGLLNAHWELSIRLDSGSTNNCIDQILLSCNDLIQGRFIAGAGGGGFLMVILKSGVSKEQLRERLLDIFGDSGVDLWPSGFQW